MPLTQPELSLRHYSGEYPVHAHAHAQVLLGRLGRLELEVDGRAAFVDASCGLVIPAGAPHAFMCRTPAEVLVVDAPAQSPLQRVRRFALAGVRLSGDGSHRDGGGVIDGIDGLGGFGRFGGFARDASSSWDVFSGTGQGDAHSLSDDAAQLLRLALLAPRVHGNRRPLAQETLDAALDDALFEDWSSARMAALFHLSPQRFHVRWVAQTGQTPQAYLRQRRLARAALLLQGGMGLEAAALQVGYGSASALSFALRRDAGGGARMLRRIVSG